jgi:hypothetical protein
MSRKKSRQTATKPKAQTERYPQKTLHAAVEIIKYPDGSSSIVSYAAGAKLIDPDVRYAAKALDTEWFRSHPNRSHRIRKAIVGETPNVTSDTYIIVRQVRPGYHERINFEALVPVPERDPPEHLAHAYFDLLRESPVRVVHWGELAWRTYAYEQGGGTGDGPGDARKIH